MTAKRWKPGNLVYVKDTKAYKERLDQGHFAWALFRMPGISARDMHRLLAMYEIYVRNSIGLIVDYAPEYDVKTGTLYQRWWKVLVDERPVWFALSPLVSPDRIFLRPKKPKP